MLSNNQKTKNTNSTLLVKVAQLERIPYSDKPLSQGSQVIYLSPKDFEDKFNCTYTESLFGDPEKYSSYIHNPEINAFIQKNPDLPKAHLIEERLRKPLDAFVICKMDDEVGYGLFASRDIKDGEILFIYAGIVCDATKALEGFEYQYNWITETPTAVDGKQLGGLSRFMQHLPMDPKRHREYLKEGVMQRVGNLVTNDYLECFLDELMSTVTDKELDEINFNNEVKRELATSNVAVISGVIDGVPVIICKAIYGIKKCEQVGFSYGEKYWPNGKRPRYFKINGELVSKSDYSYRYEIKKYNSNISTFLTNPNPLICYKRAITLYNESKSNENEIKNSNMVTECLESAIKYLTLAIEGFTKNKKDEISRELAKCYSALASCYRNLGKIDQAKESIEKSLSISLILKSKDENDDAIKDLIDSDSIKYAQILALTNLSLIEIYKQSVKLYKDAKQRMIIDAMSAKNDIQLVIYRLQYVLVGFIQENIALTKKMTCCDTMAACYRDMGEYDKGIDFCTDMMKDFSKQNDCLCQQNEKYKGSKEFKHFTELLHAIQTKLTQMDELRKSNTIAMKIF